MAAHRYWRAIGLEAYGLTGGLDITEFQLLAGTTRVDASATLTSNIAPTTGSLANLKDDNTATGAAWAAADLKTLVMSWDLGLGGDQDVTDIRIGAADDSVKFLIAARLQWSDDNTTWGESYTYNGIVWPGVRAKTLSGLRGVWNRFDTTGGWAINSTGAVLTATTTTLAGARARPAASSGIRQFEIVVSGLTSVLVGVATKSAAISPLPGSDASGWMLIVNNAQKYSAGVSTSYGVAVASGDVIGVVVDFGAGTLTFYKNGVSMGVAFSGMSGALYPVAGVNSVGARTFTLNAAGAFAYPIAGATAWDATYEVQWSAVSRTAAPVVPPSAMSVVYSYGAIRLSSAVRGRKDYVTGVLGQGLGRVKGTTKDKGTPNVPVSERVRLYREADGLLIREAWSAAGTGAYSFDYVDEMQTYTVISYDHDKNFRAVVADGLTVANGGVEVIA